MDLLANGCGKDQFLLKSVFGSAVVSQGTFLSSEKKKGVNMKNIRIVTICTFLDIALLVYGTSGHVDFLVSDGQLRISRTEWFSAQGEPTVILIRTIAKVDFEGTAYTRLGKRRRHSGGVFLTMNDSKYLELPLPGSPSVKWDKQFSAVDFYQSFVTGIKNGTFEKRIWTKAGDARELSYLPTLFLVVFGLRAIVKFVTHKPSR